MALILVATLLGGIVGLLLALTGAGGGILAVPLLVFGLHLGVAQAAPVGLAAVGLSAGLGAALGLRARIVRYRAAAFIGGLGMLVAPAGVAAAQRIPNAPLTLAFAVVLASVAARTFRRTLQAPGQPSAPRAALPCVVDAADGRLVWTRPCAQALALTGAASGLLSGLLGVGGGFVIVPALSRYTDLPTRSIVATSLAVIALVSIGGVGAAAAHGSLDWAIALPFSVGAMAALLAGRLVAARVAGVRLQQAFALVCALVAALLAARALGWLAMPVR